MHSVIILSGHCILRMLLIDFITVYVIYQPMLI